MKSGKSFYFVFLIIAIQLANAKYGWWLGSKVLELNDGNFYSFVGKEKHVVVEFYTKSCKYCEAMAQDYEKFNEMYTPALSDSPLRKDVIIARIDVNENREIQRDFGIFSYPQIFFFTSGNKEPKGFFLRDDRTLDNFIDWINLALHSSGSFDTKALFAEDNEEDDGKLKLYEKEIRKLQKVENQYSSKKTLKRSNAKNFDKDSKIGNSNDDSKTQLIVFTTSSLILNAIMFMGGGIFTGFVILFFKSNGDNEYNPTKKMLD